MTLLLQTESRRIGDPSLGIIVPAVLFAVSFLLTWMLYKHFSRRPPSQ